MKRKAAIFDHDGTLSDAAHRVHLIQGDSKDWPAFFDAASEDKSNPSVIKELRAHQKTGHKIIIMTGLPESYRAERLGWYRRHKIKVDELWMRPEKSFEKAHNLKAQWLYKLQADYDFVAAYDDESGNLDVFKNAGIPSYLVVNGMPEFKHGKAPKAGKGTGRKPKEETKVVSVRWPASYIKENNISARWVKFLVEKEVKRLKNSDDQALKCANNTGVNKGEIGLCAAQNYSKIIPGTCPCPDFEAT